MADTVKVILAKKEAVYGTDIVPTPGANAVLTRNFTSEPIVVDTLERNLDLPSRGRKATANTNRRTTFSYELELCGSGDAGTAAPWMEHFEACGMAAPILTADEDAVQAFAPPSAAMSSLSVYHWTGGERVKARGVRGNISTIDFTAGQYPFAKLDMTGLLPAPPAAAVDGVAPGAAADLSRWLEPGPVEVNTDNTDFTLDGFALVLKSLVMNINAEIAPVNLVGKNYIRRGDHAITGTIVGEAPSLGAKNYYAQLDAGDECVMQLVHGIVAGNIVQLDGGQLQILKITRSEENDTLMLNIEFGLNVSDAGADDLIITAK